VRITRDHRNEQCAVLDLAADRRIPSIAAAKLALVKPDLDACGAQRIAKMLGGLGVLGGVAEEYRLARLGQSTHAACWLSGLLARWVVTMGMDLIVMECRNVGGSLTRDALQARYLVRDCLLRRGDFRTTNDGSWPAARRGQHRPP
jgi:hypothetical protein